jgi:hypothetical protein
MASPSVESSPIQRAPSASAAGILRMQSTAGNRAVQRQVRDAGVLKLPEKFKDEDKKVGWRATYGMDVNALSPEQQQQRAAIAERTDVVTKYNSPEEIAANTLTPSGEGQKALTTATGEKASMRATEYAMSPTGQVVANLSGRRSNTLPTGQRQSIHHSTMLAGGDVAHAGHIGVNEGQVNYLDDDSGHYRPSEAHTYDAFNRLADSGVLNSDSATGRVNLVDKKGVKGVNRGESASVHFSGYKQAQGNETGIRNKSAMLKELGQKVPRYEQPERPAPSPVVEAESSEYALSNVEAPLENASSGGLALDESVPDVPAPSVAPGPEYRLSDIPLEEQAPAPAPSPDAPALYGGGYTISDL